MGLDLSYIARLSEAKVREGERWLFSADFNIQPDEGGVDGLKSTDRIDAEARDVRHILDQKGSVLFLAHNGRFSDGSARHLDYVMMHLRNILGNNVEYYPENSTDQAIKYSRSVRPGSVAVMGNTRMNEGEEKNDSWLAKRFAQLGDCVAVGGFGKAHRAHASNVGILEHLEGYMTSSQLHEMMMLGPWTGADSSRYSIAVLGGVKKEKITIGLMGFSRSYDVVLPGGIVLNTIYKALGYEIADSIYKDCGMSFERDVADFLKTEHAAKVMVPKTAIIARLEDEVLYDLHPIEAKDGVPKGYMIVDHVPGSDALDALDQMAETNGRLLMAGTPCMHHLGATESSNQILARMVQNLHNCAVLGGDTVAHLGYEGPKSTGGGSALYFAVHGTTPVLHALRRNKSIFRHGY